MDAESTSVREKLDAAETARNSVLEKTPTPVPSVHSDDKENKDVKETQEEPIDDEAKYPPLATKVAVGIGLALAVFLVSPPPSSFRPIRVDHKKVAVDQTIVATAIPQISDHFHALNDVGWYASAFFLTTYVCPQGRMGVLMVLERHYNRPLESFIKYSM